MKRFLSSIITFAFCLLAMSQDPASFNYQTIIHNAEGKVVASQEVSIKISIITGIPQDTIVYSEKHLVTTDNKGLASLTIGNGSDKTADFSSIDWNSGTYFLKLETDPDGGTNYTELSVSQILNRPYSISPETSKKTSVVEEDKLFMSRKYVGTFVDFRQTGPKTYNGPNIIWIKTSMDKTLGKISAYGKKCAFSPGDKLYLKRTYFSPGGVSGYWEYQIENDYSVYYRVTNFQHDRKVPVENRFK